MLKLHQTNFVRNIHVSYFERSRQIQFESLLLCLNAFFRTILNQLHFPPRGIPLQCFVTKILRFFSILSDIFENFARAATLSSQKDKNYYNIGRFSLAYFVFCRILSVLSVLRNFVTRQNSVESPVILTLLVVLILFATLRKRWKKQIKKPLHSYF